MYRLKWRISFSLSIFILYWLYFLLLFRIIFYWFVMFVMRYGVFCWFWYPHVLVQTNSSLLPLVCTLQKLSAYSKHIHNGYDSSICEDTVKFYLSKTVLMPQLYEKKIAQRFQLRQAPTVPFCLEPEFKLPEPISSLYAQPEQSIQYPPLFFLKIHFSIILPCICMYVCMLEALRYKPEGRGIDSRWCQNFSLT
jgi:hypothetical protein